MGFKPDEVFDIELLQGQNMDQKQGLNLNWTYPPVLLLEAENDQIHYHDRIQNTVNFLTAQVNPCFSCQEYKSA